MGQAVAKAEQVTCAPRPTDINRLLGCTRARLVHAAVCALGATGTAAGVRRRQDACGRGEVRGRLPPRELQTVRTARACTVKAYIV
jgi:hypothetical protein